MKPSKFNPDIIPQSYKQANIYIRIQGAVFLFAFGMALLALILALSILNSENIQILFSLAFWVPALPMLISIIVSLLFFYLLVFKKSIIIASLNLIMVIGGAILEVLIPIFFQDGGNYFSDIFGYFYLLKNTLYLFLAIMVVISTYKIRQWNKLRP